MTQVEGELLGALRDLTAGVKEAPGRVDRPDYQELFRRIDRLAEQLPRGASPDLEHFLRKKSYEKALLWLESRSGEIERGGCIGD